MSKVEEYIKKHTKRCSNRIGIPIHAALEWNYFHWLTPDQARCVAEIAKEEIIDKACKWICYNNNNGGCLFDGWEESFRKAMEE